jgi:ubiquinone/menaquinone biosynthesis C-methylase UbiE
MDKLRKERAYFDEPDRYLRLRYYIDTRAAIVREVCGEVTNARILEVGCGDGSISRQFCKRGENHVVLLDISRSMILIAKRRLSRQHPHGCTPSFVVGDEHCLSDTPVFDLVLALGVLAHVNNPEQFIGKLASVVKRGGRLVMQLTDYASPLGFALWHYRALRDAWLGQRAYAMNKLTTRHIVGTAAGYRLTAVHTVRHSLMLPGLDRILPDSVLFKYETLVTNNRILRSAALDRIIVFRKD